MNFHDYKVEDFVCDESFQRYCLDGNDTDTAFWENWIATHPERQALIAEARQMIVLLSAGQGNRLEQLRQLQDGIAQYDLLRQALEKGALPIPEDTAPITPRRTRYVRRYATALAIFVPLAVWAWLFFLRAPQKPAVTTPANAAFFSAGNDPRKTVVLPDGSVIILRAHSTIALNEGFNLQNRQLTLTGEAFFDVAHDVQRPFLVHTALADIKVLGTVFNVSINKDHKQMETALFKGSVEVVWKEDANHKIILSPNQKLVIGNNIQQPITAAGAFKVAPLDADPVNHKAREIAWVRNRLEIENEPLVQIAAKLEKWYGIPVQFADEEVKGYRYSGTFESETVVKALDALQLSYPFNFKMENGVIIISK
ncbi:DUF4974 domain-containing protein [Chitinophaga agrisoli]|uniref:DUF4974 domain-containing protein n=1 Tax=Chitinophaga agrisoli TaxID=2607653 RepID=A0A5B2VNQ1_9BACT|nr:FecR domain-containing protein [Chitinophaga agrisoli]KAA2240731.1 DUF4974 domain-containing protein [Chitinophaga agrisoli]